MPLWLIFHPPGTFQDDESKEAFAKDITAWYSTNRAKLPKFYVVVKFIQLPMNNVYVGGELRKDKTPFIRIAIEHIAVHQPNEDAAYKRVTKGIDGILKPHIADKGYDWEFHVDQTERRLWMINGLYPPPVGSAAQELWHRENRAVPWENVE